MGQTCKLPLILDHLITIQSLLDDLVVCSWLLEVWIVHLAASSWVDSYKMTTTIMFYSSLT